MSRKFQIIRVYSSAFLNILETIISYQYILECCKTFWNSLVTFENLPDHSGTFKSTRESHGIFWNIVDHFKTYLYFTFEKF